jgi:hypothetical protein
MSDPLTDAVTGALVDLPLPGIQRAVIAAEVLLAVRGHVAAVEADRDALASVIRQNVAWRDAAEAKVARVEALIADADRSAVAREDYVWCADLRAALSATEGHR